jgi:hypothetical protein
MNIEFEDLIKDFKDNTKNNETYGHSEFQIRNFIINSQPTDYGKYKQCVLEIRSRIKSYENIIIEYNKLLEQEQKDHIVLKKISEFEIIIEDIKREVYIFYDIYKDLVGKIDLTKKEQLEEEYWNKKFQKELKSYVLIGQFPPISLIQSILDLPKYSEVRNELIRMIGERINEKRITYEEV